MADKFIPNGDMNFKVMADAFARCIARDPARFAVTQADAEALSQAVEKYRAAFQAAGGGSRSRQTTRAKDEAREQAERIIRRLANLIRASESVDAPAKFELNLRERAAKSKPQRAGGCPQEPPRLWFARALHEGNGAAPMHELKFFALDHSRAKPQGAVRLELFVDLVPPEEPIPAFPGAGANWGGGGRPWYLRSFTRSPIVLAPPMARVPMRVVYWGRWADSTGNVGPFSKTAVAWIEGGSHHLMGPRLGRSIDPQPMPLLEDVAATELAGGPARRQLECSVMVLEAQYHSFNTAHIVPALEAKGVAERAVRQLESAAG